MRRFLMITGLPRGGTSMAAALAERLGIPMHGPGARSESAEDVKHRYPVGNVEDTEFREFVWRAIECQPGCSTKLEYGYSDSHRDFSKVWRTRFNAYEGNEFRNWLDRRFADTDVCGVKLPSLCYVLPALIQEIRKTDIKPLVVFVLRPVMDAIQSLCEKRGTKNDPERPFHWAQAVQAYNEWHLQKAISYAERTSIPWLSLTFDDLVKDPHVSGEILAEYAGVQFQPESTKVIDASLHFAAQLTHCHH
jgi:hypothetical protein